MYHVGYPHLLTQIQSLTRGIGTSWTELDVRRKKKRKAVQNEKEPSHVAMSIKRTCLSLSLSSLWMYLCLQRPKPNPTPPLPSSDIEPLFLFMSRDLWLSIGETDSPARIQRSSSVGSQHPRVNVSRTAPIIFHDFKVNPSIRWPQGFQFGENTWGKWTMAVLIRKKQWWVIRINRFDIDAHKPTKVHR